MQPSKNSTEIFTSLVAIVLCLSGAISGYSQVTGATLSGTVSDSSGCSHTPEHKSPYENAATGIVTDVMGNADGYYTASELGTRDIYDVRVTANGFKHGHFDHYLGGGGLQQQLNIPMKVGGNIADHPSDASCPRKSISLRLP